MLHPVPNPPSDRTLSGQIPAPWPPWPAHTTKCRKARGLSSWPAKDVFFRVSGAAVGGVGSCRSPERPPVLAGAWPNGGEGWVALLAKEGQDWGVRVGKLALSCLVPPYPCLSSILSSGEPPPTTLAPRQASRLLRPCQEGCCHLHLTVSSPGAGEAPPAFPNFADSPRNVMDSGTKLRWALALCDSQPARARRACLVPEVLGLPPG